MLHTILTYSQNCFDFLCRYGEEPDYPYNNPPTTEAEFYVTPQFGHFTQVCGFSLLIAVVANLPCFEIR